MASFEQLKSMRPWILPYLWERRARRPSHVRPVHLIIGIADHFEPMARADNSKQSVDRREQQRRLRRWCREYPAAVDQWRDHEGQPLRHTYFYPAEEYDEGLIDELAAHCHGGWGEIEIHLHHGVERPDTSENTARTLIAFRDALAARSCLSRENGTGPPRYGFVHGNWALANSDGGRFCGVDDEMQILSDTGCYADFTMPAPSSAQVRKINSLYECSLPLNQRSPHRRGIDLMCGHAPATFPLMMQGPLGIDFGRPGKGWLYPGMECGELSGSNPPTLRRMRLWRDAAIGVQGRPAWVFIKLHCHGMQARDESAMFGPAMKDFLRELVEGPGNGPEYRLHFVTMREMVNIALAACDQHDGNPGDYRNYRFTPIKAAAAKLYAGATTSSRD